MKKIFCLQSLILFASACILGVNGFYLYAHTQTRLIDPNLAFVEHGWQFADFRDKLKGVRTIGFLTNKDMSSEKNDGEFLQAQYILAPTVLEINNTAHPLQLMDYTDQVFVFYMLKQLNAVVIHDNAFNKVLCKKQ